MAVSSRPRASVLVVASLLCLLGACGKGGATAGSDKVASCHTPKFKSCREYRGDNLALGLDSLKKLCADGEFKEAACPTEGSIGACQVREHKDLYFEGYLGGAPDALEKACKANAGEFTTGK
ncbi:MAG: hypothetical protein HY908_03780 [Myxococcales bacterium]|nr:hypothetical protein [Myxococcales bacterium]